MSPYVLPLCNKGLHVENGAKSLDLRYAKGLGMSRLLGLPYLLNPQTIPAHLQAATETPVYNWAGIMLMFVNNGNNGLPVNLRIDGWYFTPFQRQHCRPPLVPLSRSNTRHLSAVYPGTSWGGSV